MAGAEPGSTQTRHPWRATLRTILAVALASLPLLPVVAETAHLDSVPAVVRVLAGAAIVTRVLAIPGVDRLLKRYLPILATAPSAAR